MVLIMVVAAAVAEAEGVVLEENANARENGIGIEIEIGMVIGKGTGIGIEMRTGTETGIEREIGTGTGGREAGRKIEVDGRQARSWRIGVLAENEGARLGWRTRGRLSDVDLGRGYTVLCIPSLVLCFTYQANFIHSTPKGISIAINSDFKHM